MLCKPGSAAQGRAGADGAGFQALLPALDTKALAAVGSLGAAEECPSTALFLRDEGLSAPAFPAIGSGCLRAGKAEEGLVQRPHIASMSPVPITEAWEQQSPGSQSADPRAPLSRSCSLSGGAGGCLVNPSSRARAAASRMCCCCTVIHEGQPGHVLSPHPLLMNKPTI